MVYGVSVYISLSREDNSENCFLRKSITLLQVMLLYLICLIQIKRKLISQQTFNQKLDENSSLGKSSYDLNFCNNLHQSSFNSGP